MKILRRKNGKSSLPRILSVLLITGCFLFWLNSRLLCFKDHRFCISNGELSTIGDDISSFGSNRKYNRHPNRKRKRNNQVNLRNNKDPGSAEKETLSEYSEFLSSVPLTTVVPLGLPCWSNYSYLHDILRFSEADALTHTLLAQSALPQYTDTDDTDRNKGTSSTSASTFPLRTTDEIGTICRYYPSGDEGGVQCCCEKRKYISRDISHQESTDEHHTTATKTTGKNLLFEMDPSGLFTVQSLTCLPRLIVVGEMKAGTSALFLTVVTGESSVNQPEKKSTDRSTLASTTQSDADLLSTKNELLKQEKLSLLNKLMNDNRNELPPVVANMFPQSLSNFRPPPPPMVPVGANIPNMANHNPMFVGSSLSRNTQGPPNAPPLPGWLPPPQGPGFMPNPVAFTAKLGPRAPSTDQDRRYSFVSLSVDDLSSKDLTFVGGSAKELNYFSIAAESSPVMNAFDAMQHIVDTVSLSPSFTQDKIQPHDLGLESSGDRAMVHNPWHSHPSIYDMLIILYPCELSKMDTVTAVLFNNNNDNNNKQNSHHCPKDPYDEDYENGFSITPAFRRRALHVRWRLIIDSSPAYLNFPLAIFRALRMLPYSHFTVLIRNPVDRAYSEYQMAHRSGIQLPTADLCFKESLNRLIDCSELSDSTPSLNTSFRDLHTLRNKWDDLFFGNSMKNRQKWPGTVDVTGPRAKFNDLYPNCWPKGGLDDIGRDALYRSLPLPHLKRIYSILLTQSKYSIFPFDERLKIIWTQNLKDNSDQVLRSIEIWLGMTKRHRVSTKVQTSCSFGCNRDLEGLEALFSNKHMEEAMALGLNGGNSNRYQQLDPLIYQYWLDVFKPYDASLFDWLSDHPDLILHPTVIDDTTSTRTVPIP